MPPAKSQAALFVGGVVAAWVITRALDQLVLDQDDLGGTPR